MDSMGRSNSSMFLVLAIVVVLIVGGVAIYYVNNQNSVTTVPIQEQPTNKDNDVLDLLQAKLDEEKDKNDQLAKSLADIQQQIEDAKKAAQQPVQNVTKSDAPAMEFEFTSAFLKSGSFQKESCTEYRSLAQEFSDDFKDDAQSDFEDETENVVDEIVKAQDMISDLEQNVTNNTIKDKKEFSSRVGKIEDAISDAEDAIADAISAMPYEIRNTDNARNTMLKFEKALTALSKAEEKLSDAEDEAADYFKGDSEQEDINDELSSADEDLGDASDYVDDAETAFKKVRDDVRNKFVLELNKVC